MESINRILFDIEDIGGKYCLPSVFGWTHDDRLPKYRFITNIVISIRSLDETKGNGYFFHCLYR